MAIVGRKPKPEGLRRNHVKPVHDWLEVEDVPFDGAPPLQGRRSKAIRDWWEAISTMPHCILWAPSDWQFCLDTSRVVARFYAGDFRLAGEIRQRERQMGTTIDARRDLRIRYVDEAPAVEPGSVTSLGDYIASISAQEYQEERRRRLTARQEEQ